MVHRVGGEGQRLPAGGARDWPVRSPTSSSSTTAVHPGRTGSSAGSTGMSIRPGRSRGSTTRTTTTAGHGPRRDRRRRCWSPPTRRSGSPTMRSTSCWRGPGTSTAVASAAQPRLLSVNVGMPRDVEWEGRTVHTGIWKDPVDGRQIVRRLNIDGDGQGDLARARRREPGRVRLPDRVLPLLAGVPGPRRLRLRAVRRELHGRRDWPTTRSASATATGSARRCSRSASRGSPATGSASA